MDHLGLFLFAISPNVLLLFGCSATQPPTPDEIHLSEKDGACGSTVDLNIGDSLLLALEGNPTTGYAWEIVRADPTVIEATGEPEYTPESSAIGAGGIYTFRLNAVAKGLVTLKLVYRRPFETDVPELKSCEVTINVK